MNIRKILSKDDFEELKYIIEKNIPKIDYHAKISGTKKCDTWENMVSENELLNVEKGNIALSRENANILSFSGLGITQKLIHVIERIYPQKTVFSSGFFLYPNTGYMGWHTNSNEPGKRLYITYVDKDKKSFFRYKDPVSRKIITDYDDLGFTFREFTVCDKPPYLWHCVGSMCNRYSFGFTIR